MDDVAIARAVHVLAVVLWIGGVGMVTTVVLPAAVRRGSTAARLAFFDAIERRFAWQARISVLLAGASGLYMVARLDLWSSFLSADYWWLDAMVAVWTIFALMLFVAEPLFLERWLRARALRAPGPTFALIRGLHWLLLILSLITVFGAVAGSHGVSFFG
ncbi:MAG TPA: hypothetical protein VMU85_16935 [Stellaceae bacterium]|nr:hypothetical protein [Stellaceae bacterium]